MPWSVGNDSPAKLLDLLENAYQEFHSHFYRDRDPVRFVHLYENPRDQEVVAFLSALLAYGNVTSILQSVSSILARLGPEPHQTIVRGEFSGKFNGFVHRFTKGEDIEILCLWLQSALQEKGELQRYFVDPQKPMKEKLSVFVRRLSSTPLSNDQKKIAAARSRNLKYLLSDPEQGSACKRLNMFLRWMVRPADGIDLGLWSEVSPAQLMLPVDTHILKMIKGLGWVTTEAATWKTVESATERLRQLNPQDPIRYDFSLCHLSMEGKTFPLCVDGMTTPIPKRPSAKTTKRARSISSKR